MGIGLVEVPDLPSSLADIFLVKGVGHPGSDEHTALVVDETRVNDSIDTSEQTFNSVYYLGAAPSADISSLQGCIVVFQGTHDGLVFGDPEDMLAIEMNTGTCPDVINERSINGLRAKAEETVTQTQSCQALDKMLRNEPIEACANFAGIGRHLGRYSVIDVTQLSPISKAENGTSDCWPVLPKKAQLSYITSDLVAVSQIIVLLLFMVARLVATPLTLHSKVPSVQLGFYKEMHKNTPILTVLKNDGMKENSAQLSCTKVVRGYDPDAPGLSDNDAARSSHSMLGLTFLCIFIFLCSF